MTYNDILNITSTLLILVALPASLGWLLSELLEFRTVWKEFCSPVAGPTWTRAKKTKRNEHIDAGVFGYLLTKDPIIDKGI